MRLEDGMIVYSEEDKKNLVIRKYLPQELEEKRKQFNKKRNKRRIIFAVIILFFIVLYNAVVSSQYWCALCLIFMVFLVIVCEDSDRTEIKAVLLEYYYEIQIEKLLPTESHMEGTLTPGIDLTTYFPVEGRDTTSGYRGVFYVAQDQYIGASKGEVVRISTIKETLL